MKVNLSCPSDVPAAALQSALATQLMLEQPNIQAGHLGRIERRGGLMKRATKKIVVEFMEARAWTVEVQS